MISPRWRKVFRDLWINRVRTILIVLTIAVGVFAVGVIGATKIVLQREFLQRYLEIEPAHLGLALMRQSDGVVPQVVAKVGARPQALQQEAFILNWLGLAFLEMKNPSTARAYFEKSQPIFEAARQRGFPAPPAPPAPWLPGSPSSVLRACS